MLLVILIVSALYLVNSSQIHRIVFGSCNIPQLSDKIYQTIQNKTKPNHFISLGDLIYADKYNNYQNIYYKPGSPDYIEYLYNKLLNNSHFNGLIRGLDDGLVSLLWDDHDYGFNNADKHYIYRNESKVIFNKFHNNLSTLLNKSNRNQIQIIDSMNLIDEQQQSGVYSSKTIKLYNNFTYQLILLDSRYNKDRKGTANGDFLGYEQWQWLQEQLTFNQPSDIPDLIIIGTSIQLLPNDKLLEESWSEFPLIRERILRIIVSLRMLTNVVIISGDVHCAEYLSAICSPNLITSPSIKYPDLTLNELTSSGLTHTFTRITNTTGHVISRGSIRQILNDIYQIISPNHYRRLLFGDYYRGINYGVIDILSIQSSYQMKLQISNQLADPVIIRSHNLISRSANQTTLNMINTEIRYLTNLSNELDKHGDICVPIHLPVPIYRLLLFRLLVALISMICIVIPLLTIIWFIFISIWYLIYERETRRQQSLLELYYKNK